MLVGCGANQPLMMVEAGEESPASQVDVLVSTQRAPTDDATRLFGAERSPALSFAEVTVSVPPDREPGQVRYPAGQVNLAKDFAATRIGRMNTETEFVDRLNAQLAVLPPDHRRAFVFVHGYNVSFPAGVFRHAQLMTDYKVPGVAVHYSWPSASSVGLYLYDRDSAEYAREGLVQTLRLVERSNASSIMLLGHSMGGHVVMEALRTASLKGDARLMNSLEAVVLAAPDIDVDVFNHQLDAINPLPKPFLVLVSSRDRALKMSQRLRGGTPRVGEGTNIEDLNARGIAVIDLTQLKGSDRLNHSTFATSETLQQIVTSGTFDIMIEGDNDEATKRALSASLGGLADVLAGIIYLPARALGVR
jgi:esterase/lipase superfamily enzyme